MSTKKDFKNLSQNKKGSRTPEIKTKSKKSKTDQLKTPEKDVKNIEKDLKESQAIAKESMKHDSKKLKRAKRTSEDELKLVIQPLKDLQISSQEPQPLHFSQADEESMDRQQLSLCQLDSSLPKLQSSSNPTDSSSPKQPQTFIQTDSSLAQQPPFDQPDLKPMNELKNVEAVKPQAINFEETEENKSTYEKVCHSKIICDQILKTDPLRGIGNFQIYFTQLYTEFFDRISEFGFLDKTKDEFLDLNNDYNRIRYVLQYEDFKNLEISIYNSKSEVFAKELEAEYNICCYPSTREMLPRGLQLINRSIQFTPGTYKKSIGIRIMKRAWINLLMMKFDEAREDAHRSLEHHCDRSVMWNSFEILGHCYAKRADCRTAENFFNEALNGLNQSDTDDAIKIEAENRISTVLKYVKGRRDTRLSNKKHSEDLMTPSISYGINEILECATDAVEVKVEEKTGRGLYATRDIEPGDVIIVEKPYVSALNRENFETRCNYCYKRFKSPIPCDTCSRVWFCNEECLKKAKAKNGFHLSECHVLNLLYEDGIGRMGIIVFRTLLRLTRLSLRNHVFYQS